MADCIFTCGSVGFSAHRFILASGHCSQEDEDDADDNEHCKDADDTEHNCDDDDDDNESNCDEGDDNESNDEYYEDDEEDKAGICKLAANKYDYDMPSKGNCNLTVVQKQNITNVCFLFSMLGM